jgi:3',5'-cyclic AMP phosphodiesterase CpdA
VNTTRWYRHKHGQIADAQITRVVRRLARATPAQLRVVVAHHPVLAIRTRDAHQLLRRHERAAAAFRSAGCDLVLGGHIHLPYVRPLHVEASQPSHRTWVVQAGTAVSRRTREGIPNSVNVLRIGAKDDRAGCVVERWDFDARAGDFVPVHAESLALTRPVMTPATRPRLARTAAIGSDG